MDMEQASRERWQHYLHTLKSRVRAGDVPFNEVDLKDFLAELEELSVAGEELDAQHAELEHTRDALYRERTRYEELFELAPDAYLLTDGSGLICEANQAAAVLVGVDQRFLLGKPLQVFVHEHERQQFRRHVSDLESGTSRSEFRFRLTPRDHDAIDVAASVGAIRNRHGKSSGLRWSIRDITDRVQQEARLRDLNVELERRVAERTDALQAANRLKDDLLTRERAAREVAEAANRSKDEFLATLSHELRTPLNVVLGLIFRLQSGSLSSSEQEKAIRTVDRNARELSRLVEDLLDAARIASGRMKLDVRMEELAPIIRVAIDAVEPTAETRGVRLTSNLRDGVYVKCDPERLRQVAWNLLTNALKFTPEGGTIAITVDADDRHATFSVIDTGFGIDQDIMPHIFERFWQGEQSMPRSRTGLGLGLAIVKHLVELHGGRIVAASEGSGRGATFTVELPVAAAITSVTRLQPAGD
jgi:PAS domain S-box-containing protein